jgi:predicted dithiol-disulfide oxidoreductase (DUF899 family)
MALPEIASREEWLAARRQLLDDEKALMRRSDALATRRRQLPMVEVSEPYTFTGPDGTASLLDLFEGRRQLVVYHFMFHPEWDEACSSCTAGRDAELGPGVLGALHRRDTTYALVSRAPYEKLDRWRAERGWDVPWWSTDDGPFSYHFAATIDQDRGFEQFNYAGPEHYGDDWYDAPQPFDMPGRSCFLRDGDRVFHTYSTYGRGTEQVGGTHYYLDLTALGRQEDWEEPRDRSSASNPPAGQA